MAGPRKPRRGKAAGGKNWSELSASYRTRLKGAGITAKDWYAGADLRTVRGHKPQPKDWAAPVEASHRLTAGEATAADIAAVESWAARPGPSWIPDDMSVDARAALSQIDIPPSRWAAVHFTPRADGEPWTMRVTPSGAPVRADGTSPYDRTVEIPGGGGAHSYGAREILDWLMYDDDVDDIDFDIGESE